MTSEEKLRRALADEWEFVGDSISLCQLLRGEVLRLQEALERERAKVRLLHDATVIARQGLCRSYPPHQHAAHEAITRIVDQVAAMDSNP